MTVTGPTPTEPTPDQAPNRRVSPLVVGLVAFVLLVAVVVAVQAAGSDDGDQLQAAPDLTVQLLDGGQVELADFEGGPLVVNFLASWCGPCRAELPDLQAAFVEYGDDVTFLGVGVNDSPEAVQQLIDDTGVTFTIALDPDAAIRDTFSDLRAMPTTVFIDADGNIVNVHAGILTGGQVDEIIRGDLLP